MVQKKSSSVLKLVGVPHVVGDIKLPLGVDAESGQLMWTRFVHIKKGDFNYCFEQTWDGRFGGARNTPHIKYVNSLNELKDRFPLLQDQLQDLFGSNR